MQSDDLLRPVASPSNVIAGRQVGCDRGEPGGVARRTGLPAQPVPRGVARAAAGLYARELRIGSLPFMVAPAGFGEIVRCPLGRSSSCGTPTPWELRSPAQTGGRCPAAPGPGPSLQPLHLGDPLPRRRSSSRTAQLPAPRRRARIDDRAAGFGLATYFDKLDLSGRSHTSSPTPETGPARHRPGTNFRCEPWSATRSTCDGGS
ncbi:hypothetical protein HBB16_13290 [Pseudonocardia sp. MCCB 268]|nr:hypothetical protein [Pseudonocardia cytotoxica]